MIISSTKRLHVPSLEALTDFARTWLERHPEGALVALNGELGAGKTAFVQTVMKLVCDQQGCAPVRITSPTYVLHQSYESPVLEHFDWYRLEKVSDSDLVEMGFWESAERAKTARSFVFVEWAERIHGADLEFDAQLLFEVDETGQHHITESLPVGRR